MPPEVSDDRAYRRTWWAWALYDVANSAFYLIIVAAVFPFFFQEIYLAGQVADPSALSEAKKAALRTQGASLLALTAGIAMAFVAVLGPVLGAVADRCGNKKKFLTAFMTLGAGASALMFLIGERDVTFAAILYAVGTVGVAGSIVFYDALLPGVARPSDLDRISTIGFSLGYAGSVLLLIVDFVLITSPAAFGLSGAGAAVRWSFLGVAIWWVLFSIPLLRKVPEPPCPPRDPAEASVVWAGFRQLGRTLRKVGRYRQLLLFLIAYWIYSDGIGTIIKMATPFGYSLGVKQKDLMLALILTQVVGVPCALLFGKLAGRIGSKAGILLGLGVYAAICASATLMTQTWHFYALAVAVGLVQGGTQALSRSLFTKMIPSNQAGEFFGFFSTMEKFAGILGPLLLAILWGGRDPDPRRGILALSAFFVVGGALLWRVNVAEGQRAAAAAQPEASPA